MADPQDVNYADMIEENQNKAKAKKIDTELSSELSPNKGVISAHDRLSNDDSFMSPGEYKAHVESTKAKPVKNPTVESTKTVSPPNSTTTSTTLNKKVDNSKISKHNANLNKGILAGTTGLKIGANATGALANIMDTMRQANKAALNVDALGTNTVTSTLNVADKVGKDVQSTLTDTGKTIDSAKKDSKALKDAEVSNKNNALKDKIDELQSDAIKQVAGDVDFYDLTPEQVEQVNKIYDENLNKYLTEQFGDYTKLDPNSDTAKIVNSSFRDLTQRSGLAGRGHRNELRQEKVALKEQRNEQKRVGMGLDEIRDSKKLNTLRNGLGMLDKAGTDEEKLMYDIAGKVDADFADHIYENGAIDGKLLDSMINEAQNRYDSAETATDKQNAMNVLSILKDKKQDRTDVNTQVGKDIYVQKLKDSMSDTESFINRITQNNKNKIFDETELKDQIVPIGMAKQFQDLYIPEKEKALESSGILVKNPNNQYVLAKDWDDMTDDEKAQYNELKIVQMATTNSGIRDQFHKNIDNLTDTKKFFEKDPARRKKIIEAANKNGFKLTDAQIMRYSYVLQEKKDELKAKVDGALADHLKLMREEAENGKNVSMLENTDLIDNFDEIYNEVLAKELGKEAGLFLFHEKDSPVPQSQTELLNLTNYAQSTGKGTGERMKPIPGWRVYGHDGAKLLRRKLWVNNKDLFSIDSNDLNDLNTRINNATTPAERENLTLRRNRVVVSKMMLGVINDSAANEDQKKAAQVVLGILYDNSKKGLKNIDPVDKDLIDNGLRAFINAPNLDFGNMAARYIGGFNMNNANYMPYVPPMVGGRRNVPPAQDYWREQVRALTNPAVNY